MGREPASLFLYGDGSVAARSVRQAIYDGPTDILGFERSPVILARMPSIADGNAIFETVTVEAGDLVVDSSGDLVALDEEVNYYSAGCTDLSCVQTYTGQEPVQMDQLVVRYDLLAGLKWSDGAPISADDSRYSFEVASGLYPRARAGLILRTEDYQALDASTLEWRGVPGYRDADYGANFFTPLPRHAWGNLSVEDLLTAEISSRTPLGWGPYRVDEWTAGDHITLSRNPNYFRSEGGLPVFDKLVFRFISNQEDALEALQAGECDYLDETIHLESQSTRLFDLPSGDKIKIGVETGSAWEHIDFGITPYTRPGEAAKPSFFQSKETRQAIAMCIDRQRMVDELFFGESQVPDSFVHPDHPLANPDVEGYAYNPQEAGGLLDAAGWMDLDGDPATPRVAQGVEGIQDGTPFEFEFLTAPGDEKAFVAEMVQESLTECGIKVEISSQDWETLFAPGPEGPIFGRDFSVTQFAWVSAVQPPCYLYTTREVPGPYPEHPKGWGGSNASGYSNSEFDQACQGALSTLPDFPGRQAAHYQAQAIFAEDLPAVPLYLRLKLVAMRADMCGVVLDPSADSALWNLENFDYGDECSS